MGDNTTISKSGTRLSARCAAIVETGVIFALVHVSYRAFKRFTAAGHLEADWHLNYSPGIFMIVTTVVMMLFSRQRPSTFGLVFSRWREHVAIGLVAGLVAALGAMLIVVLGGFQILPGKPPPSHLACIAAVGELAIAVAMLRTLRDEPSPFTRVWPLVSCTVLAAVIGSPALLAAYAHKPLDFPIALSIELLVCAGFGEEAFFRGYIQSRLNTTFGRPWRLIGAEFGPGLLISAALFGLVHALNTTDYFEGRFEFAWAWGLMNFCVGVFFGLLREHTGSILPGVVAHTVTNVLTQLPAFLPRA